MEEKLEWSGDSRARVIISGDNIGHIAYIDEALIEEEYDSFDIISSATDYIDNFIRENKVDWIKRITIELKD